MSQTGPAPVIAQDYLQVDPFKAPTRANQNEVLSQGFQDPAFLYAWQQNVGLLPPAWEGDNATIDAIYAIAQKFKTPPAAPTLTGLSPNTAPAGSGPFLMTCTGTGFALGAIVLFGVAPETRVTVISPTSLTVTCYPGYIPAAGTVNIAVKNGGGAAASATVAFTVT